MPPKAIFVLLSLKSQLINKKGSTSTEKLDPQSVTRYTLDPINSRNWPKSTVRMRHAKSGGAFQRSCQRKDFSSPVY